MKRWCNENMQGVYDSNEIMERTRSVSVVMATYNGEKFIKAQLDSILSQSYPIHEIIIQDDCSTDSTVEIVREYMSRVTNIKLFVNDTNVGYNENFRTAVMRSTSDLVAISDQDDVWFPEKIAIQVESIKDKSMCYCFHLKGVDMEHSSTVKYKCAPERQIFDAVVGHSMLLDGVFARNLDNWLPYVAYDYSIGIMAHLANGVVRVDMPLVWHRTHNRQVTHTPIHQNSKYYPYLRGYYFFRRLQNNANYIGYFTAISKSSKPDATVNKISRLMISRSFWDYLKLSYLCMTYFRTICPSECGAVIGRIRGFFHPGIWATYHVSYF